MARNAEQAGEGNPTGSEEELLRLRREKAGVDPVQRPWALAFSGGGIRSATFCLGLARALAQNGVFKRFDYLSTVSGGGYIGSALGRLYSGRASPAKVSAGLADDNSLFLWWIRRNGRFLLPAGANDLLKAGAAYFRGFLATQAEIAVLALLAACLAMLPHLLMTMHAPLQRWGSAFGNPWWSLLPALAVAALALLFAYWFSREPSERQARLFDVIWSLGMAALAVVILCLISREDMTPGSGERFKSLLVVEGVLVSAPAGWLLHFMARRLPARDARVRFTDKLALVIALALLSLVLGLLDFLTWVTASWLARGRFEIFFGGVGAAALLAAVMRAAAPVAQKFVPQSTSVLAPEKLAHYLGLLLLVLIVALWLLATQWLVFFVQDFPSPTDGGCVLCATVHGALPTTAFGRWGGLLVLVLLYMLMTGRNLDQLNRASLYPFYRSRLARAYVSVGNSPDHASTEERPLRFPISVLEVADSQSKKRLGKITDYLEGDDIRIGEYRPHEHGGPVHLVNCCINQTVDDRTGSYNADRKGVALTVSSLGVEIGPSMPFADSEVEQTELSQWVAISGAAVGSGMGSITRPGLAALSFLTGVRLGYWWARGRSWRRPLAKYLATLRELLGKFPGLNSPSLYLSDGGHFDNTGVYALLKRRPAVIVAADCGADPGYLFNDIENLVRKARIDYDADIEFIHPGSLRGVAEAAALLEYLGTPDSITPEPRSAYLLLARISYADGTRGALLVVKPRRIKRLPLDVAGYSDRDVLFPQQTTGDQFFDEAQWESYCELGRSLGGVITPELLDALPACAQLGVPVGTTSLASVAVPPDDADAGNRRQRFAVTVGKTLSAGAALSLVVAGWQIWQESRESLRTARKAEIETVVKLVRGEKENEPSPVAQILKDGAFNPHSLQQLLARIEEIGSLYGDDVQESARRKVVGEVYQQCARLTMPGGRVMQDLDGVQRSSLETCARVLSALSRSPRSPWSIAVDDYWDSAIVTGRQPSAACELPAGGRLYLAIHADRGADAVQLRTVMDRAIEEGLRVSVDEGIAVEARGRQALAPFGFDRMMLVSDEQDAGCVASLIQRLDAGLGGTGVEDGLVPQFGYALGELQLWIPAAVARPVTAAMEPAAMPASTGRTVAGDGMDADMVSLEGPSVSSEGTEVVMSRPRPGGGSAAMPGPAADGDPLSGAPSRPPSRPPLASGLRPPAATMSPTLDKARVVYVQFRGAVTRRQINAYRAELKKLWAGGGNDSNVPGAERIDSDYPNVVKYFREEDAADARLVAKRTNAYFKAGGDCELSAEIEAKPHRARDSRQIEVWVAPRCRGGR
ncbi:MAG TPA: patatin-like phospholipase family protein [Solimonas sp.]|nr:patatin-like phospholipase family protein [Solimonas sp.]